jgi:alkylhydroperoxidase/carboxymuconolactone decarboxylase family protein YurZ
VHARAALENGELTPEQLRETLVLLAPYAGYPCVNGLIAPTETAIHEWTKAGHVHSHES